MNKQIIVFAPHPDDETLGCGGTIAKKIAEGFDVIVVLMTDGRHALSVTAGITSDPSPEEVKNIRSEEFIRAMSILGVPERNLIKLDFEDGTLTKHEREAEEEITRIMMKYSPVEVYFPFIRDCHLDHQVTNRITEAGAKKLGLACLKYQYSIVHKYARVGPTLERLLSFFKSNAIKVDISEFLNLKERALKEFRAGLGMISSKQDKPLFANVERFLKDQETFYVG